MHVMQSFRVLFHTKILTTVREYTYYDLNWSHDCMQETNCIVSLLYIHKNTTKQGNGVLCFEKHAIKV